MTKAVRLELLKIIHKQRSQKGVRKPSWGKVFGAEQIAKDMRGEK
jgi:hypothetical protein